MIWSALHTLRHPYIFFLRIVPSSVEHFGPVVRLVLLSELLELLLLDLRSLPPQALVHPLIPELEQSDEDVAPEAVAPLRFVVDDVHVPVGEPKLDVEVRKVGWDARVQAFPFGADELFAGVLAPLRLGFVDGALEVHWGFAHHLRGHRKALHHRVRRGFVEVLCSFEKDDLLSFGAEHAHEALFEVANLVPYVFIDDARPSSGVRHRRNLAVSRHEGPALGQREVCARAVRDI
mmetsp:Transcript_25464/g.83816  ORF Transcript_25464/g.83816 Transcript_25464/m.83816 type:complete len:234 (+) Transcript_25464:15-716(+)